MAKGNSQKKVLMLCANYMEDYEAMVPFQALQAYGVAVDAVCPGKKAGDICRTLLYKLYPQQPNNQVIPGQEDQRSHNELRGHNFVLNATFDEVDDSNYDGLVIPGGRAPEYLALNKSVVDLVGKFSSSDKPIASICHGQLILAAAKCIKGYKCTAYPTLEPVLTAAGATWLKANETYTTCIRDRKLITGVAYPGHPNYIQFFVEALGVVIRGASDKRILFLCGDFMEDYEIKVPFQSLEALGCHVDAVCPTKAKGGICPTAILDDFESDWTYIERPGHDFTLTANFDEINPTSYDALVIPGGQAPEYLALNVNATSIVESFIKANKPVASISQGLRVLSATADVLKGKKCTGHPLVKLNAELAGASWVEPRPFDCCVKDGNLVTLANWAGHPKLISEFMALLGISSGGPKLSAVASSEPAGFSNIKYY